VINRSLAKKDNRLGKMIEAKEADQDIVEAFYLGTLCRLPAKEERDKAAALLAKTTDRRAALEDLLWGLLNAKEFLLRP
jgi:hypothetical protein